jgi:YD repeat-containing protein
MKKNLFLLLCTLLRLGTLLHAQTVDPIPPSPMMASFQRFGDYPVSYATGVPGISVPLYDIKLKDFDWPISIDFHASGRRGTSDLSTLGVGWVLKASGYISRQIKEGPDEDYTPMEISASNTTDLNPGGTHYPYDRVINADMSEPGARGTWAFSQNQKEDAEHDIYSWGVGNMSGKFVNDIVHNCLPLTYSPFRMSGTAPGQFSGMDEKGAQYFFGISDQAIEVTNISPGGVGATATPHNMGWYLNQIITPAHDTIFFQYGSRMTNMANDNVSGNYTPGDYWTVGYLNPTQANITNNPNFQPLTNYYSNLAGAQHQYGSTGIDYSVYYLQEIDFKGGKVVFTYDNLSLFVTHCQVTNSNNRVIKNIDFNYVQGQSPALYNNNSLFLSTLQFKDAGNLPVETYAFGYYDGGAYTGTSVNQFPTYTDWWGYCNGTGNQAPVPPDPPIESPAPGCVSCKEPVFSNARSGMLKSITYPTGGNTQFVYEPNLYSRDGITALPGPGIRIQQIISDDGNGNKLTRQFKYGINENGIGQLLHYPNPIDFKTAQTYLLFFPGNIYCCQYNLTTYYYHPNASMAEAYAQPIYYPAVTEYVTSPEGSNNGKTVYAYSLPSAYTYPGSPIPSSDYQDHFTPAGFRMKEWTGGQLTDKQVYRYRAQTNDYQLIEEESNNYDQYDYVSVPQIRLFRNMFTFDGSGGENLTIERGLADGTPNSLPVSLAAVGNGYGFIDFNDFPVESAIEKLSSSSHTVYDDQGNASVTGAAYYYDTGYYNLSSIFPSKTVTTTSTGDLLTTETQYMQTLPLFPIEKSDYRSNQDGSNNRLIGSTYTSYYYNFPYQLFKTESPVPLTDFQPASGGTKDARYAIKQGFTYDDRFNIVQQMGQDSVPTCYVWSYSSEYPVAKILNASYTAVQSVLGGNAAIVAFRNSTPTDAAVNSFLAPLRTGLPSAMVTTYTYSPLVGMTSATDVNGRTSHYEYDAYGRLKDVKDWNGNIIKTYDYHYKGQ